MNDAQLMKAMELDDAYTVVRVLASGAGGTTELVTFRDTDLFVRKRMPLTVANRGVWGYLLACDCSRLPQVNDLYTLPDQFVAVYDYVEGQTLKELVDSHGALLPAEAVRCARELCDALAWLHARGIVHRDVSPGNIVLAADGAHLIDLGIARMRNETAPHDTTLLGTWGFAAPEQYGFAQTDARSDIYSLGRLLAYMLTGAVPGEDGYDENCIPSELRAVLDRATAFEPSARYANAEELARALEEAAAALEATGGVSESASEPEPIMSWDESADEPEDEPPSVPVASAPSNRIVLTAPIVACIVLLGAFPGFIFAAAGVSLLLEPQGNVPVTSALFGFSLAIWTVASPCLESCRALSCVGRYAEGPRLRPWLLQLAKGLGMLVAVFVALTALSTLTGV